MPSTLPRCTQRHCIVIIGLLFGAVILPGSRPAFAQGEILVSKAIEFIAGYLGGKVLDQFFDPNSGANVAAIDARLQIAEEQLRGVDSKMAYEIHQLRQELNDKTSKDRIRAVIEEALNDLKSRIDSQLRAVDEHVTNVENRANRIMSAVESRTEDVDSRQRRLTADFESHKARMEECFGYLPRIPPSINSASFDSAFVVEPIKEPLLLPYCELLTKSEIGRAKYARYSELYKPGDKSIAETFRTEDRIGRQIYDLHLAAKSNLAIAKLARDELSKSLSDRNPLLRDADLKISGATWLVAATKPENHAQLGPRLPIPKKLFQNEGSQILASLKVAGGDPGVLSPLFVQQFKFTASSDLDFDTAKPETSRSPYMSARNQYASRCDTLLQKCLKVCAQAWILERKQITDQRTHGELSEAIASNRKTKQELLMQARALSQEIDKLLATCTTGYLRILVDEKANFPPQAQFREDTIMRLAIAAKVFDCIDWESPTSLATTWAQIVASANNVIPASTQAGRPAELSVVGNAQIGKKGRLFDTEFSRISVDAKTGDAIVYFKKEDRTIPTIIESKNVQDAFFLKSFVAILHKRGYLDCFNATGEKSSIKLPFAAESVAISSNHKYFAAIASDGNVCVGDLTQKRVMFSFNSGLPGSTVVELSEQSQDLGKILFWDLKSNVPRQLLALNGGVLVKAFR